jgi:hypothetical protein
MKTTANVMHLVSGDVVSKARVFVAPDVVLNMIGKVGTEIETALSNKSGETIEVRHMRVTYTSSDPRLIGHFFYKAGKQSYELYAIYDEDTCEWVLHF